jgi:Endonuclease/Exonuclease/phosphatase family
VDAPPFAPSAWFEEGLREGVSLAVAVSTEVSLFSGTRSGVRRSPRGPRIGRVAEDLRVAFWNLQNLFAPGTQKKGPSTDDELDAKLDVIAEVLNGLFDGAGPDLIGFAEIHTAPVLERLQQRLRGPYHRLFERCYDRNWTGLAALARIDRFATLERVDAYRPYEMAMPRYLIARCSLEGVEEPILLVVNHWRSRVVSAGGDAAAPARDRLKTAKALGRWLARSEDDTCVIVVGDFNAEPFDEIFGDVGLPSLRHFSARLWRGPAPSCLYNTAWRFLPEPDPWETVEASGAAYQAGRPRTTFNASSPVIFDQLLVSGRALSGGPITLKEASIAYPCPGRIAWLTESGYRRPTPWSYDEGSPLGASDHFPVVARFRMNGGKSNG